MNWEMLSCELSNHTLLEQENINAFIYRNKSFMKSVKMDIKCVSFFESIEILSFLIYAHPYIRYDEWENLIYQCLSKIRDGIYKKQILGVYAYNGLIHIGFLLCDLVKIIPEITSFKDSMDTLIVAELRLRLKLFEEKPIKSRRIYELIYGLSGILRYCCFEKKSSEWKKFTEDIVGTLYRRLYPCNTQEVVFPWISYVPSENEINNYNIDTHTRLIDYGVAHGISGTLASLANVYSLGYQQNTGELIQYLLDELSNAKYYDNGIVFWPQKINIKDYRQNRIIKQSRNRMGWCYGSPGILRAIYLAARATSRDEFLEFSIEEFKKIARLNISEYKLTSPIVCHGLAGTESIFRNMYKDTGVEEFDIKSREMMNEILADLTSDKELWKIKKYDYLDGCTGVLQTIYSFSSGKSNVNEVRMLIR